ncbi:MAG TPA: Bro-N domain-containing protein [Arsenophonus sp.]
MRSNGQKRQFAFVNQPNLYSVISCSNKPEAKQFQDWVFNEVLPSIRKTDKYEHPKY